MPGLEILLVTSPGLDLDLYRPVVHELREAGARVTPVSFPCSGDAADLGEVIVRAADGREVVVLAHGVGATLALGAYDRLEVERWVLLGPVLDVVRGPWLDALVEVPLDRARVELGVAPEDLGSAVLGEGWAEVSGCVAPGLARDVQSWIRTGSVPVDPAKVADPVWIGVGLLDEVAPVEATIPASRRFPDRLVVRPGVARFDPKDYRHLDLVRDPLPVRLAVRAATEGW